MIYYQLQYKCPPNYGSPFYDNKIYTQIRLDPNFPILEKKVDFDYTITLVQISNVAAAGFEIGSLNNKDYLWFKYS